jgi:hypothetical protein
VKQLTGYVNRIDRTRDNRFETPDLSPRRTVPLALQIVRLVSVKVLVQYEGVITTHRLVKCHKEQDGYYGEDPPAAKNDDGDDADRDWASERGSY